MIRGVFLLLFFTAHVLPAQKLIKKSLIDSDIRHIIIDATNNFELSVSTSPSNEIKLEAHIDGEYQNSLVLNLKRTGSTMAVSTDFQRNYQKPGDKLSAHKVISVGLSVILPEHKGVSIFGTNCNVDAQGDYSNLKISLADGRCLLNNVSESAAVITQSGTIVVKASKAQILAKSKYGSVEGDKIPAGDSQYRLDSVTGNIVLNKID